MTRIKCNSEDWYCTVTNSDSYYYHIWWDYMVMLKFWKDENIHQKILYNMCRSIHQIKYQKTNEYQLFQILLMVSSWRLRKKKSFQVKPNTKKVFAMVRISSPKNGRMLSAFGTILESETFAYTYLWIGHDDIHKNRINTIILKASSFGCLLILFTLDLVFSMIEILNKIKLRMTNIMFSLICRLYVIHVHAIYTFMSE